MSLIPQDIFNKIPNLYETENQKRQNLLSKTVSN